MSETAGAAATASVDLSGPEAVLKVGWAAYVRDFIQEDGRVVDHGRLALTTSEGQAYALTRALWAGDRDTFERVRTWTRDNLQGGDGVDLPAWKWGRRDDGSWGVLDPNPASDADQWLAFALLLGADRWDDPAMRAQGRGLLASLWREEVLQVGNRRVVLPGPWAAELDPVPVNPSYYLPFAYRVFAAADPDRPWADLVDESYRLFADTRSPSGLPPDWAWLDRVDGSVVPGPVAEADKRVFGYEAFRVAWTLAAEARWSDEPRARQELRRMRALSHAWAASSGTGVPRVVEPDGTPREAVPYLGMMGALLPAWDYLPRGRGEQLYRYVEQARAPGGGWGDPRDYYSQNWVWFGIALWHGQATVGGG